MTHPDRGLLDTSVVILLDRLGDPSVLPGEPLISAITLAELSVGPLVASAADRATRQGISRPPSRASNRSPSMLQRLVPSARSQRACGDVAGRHPPGPMTP